MATNFPASLDTLTNPSATDTLDSPPHDEQHADANDAIEALQAKVGVDGSAVASSLDYKVANLESRPVETKTASYVLVAADVNKRIVMNNAGATTITVDDGVFAAGDSVWIHNIGAGTCTVTAGTATVNTAGSLDLAQWEGGSLYFTSASSAIFFRGAGGVGNANFTDTETGTYSSGSTNYKYLTFTASGTLTVDTAGLADILVVGGGGGGAQSAATNFAGGGGGGGGVIAESVYLPTGTLTVTVGAGGAVTTRGNSSALEYYVTLGGGAGGLNGGGAGGDGGSGGGGGSAGSANGAGGLSLLTDFGNSGGAGGGTTGVRSTAGGGGGGGAAGQNGATVSGAGGDGLASSITNTSVKYGPGGGGGGDVTTGGGAGGDDGGGQGRQAGVTGSTAGSANSGGGGGGGNNTGAGKAGGSGVVIVRVEV